MPPQVSQCGEAKFLIFNSWQPHIATMAKDCAHFARLVIVIDAGPRHWLCAKRTSAILRLHHRRMLICT
jgi:hypothetical protein